MTPEMPADRPNAETVIAAMHDHDQTHTQAHLAPEQTAPHHVPRSVASGLAIAMIVLALIGAGAALANVSWAERYWLYLVPVFGVICTIAAWFHSRRIDRTVTRQVLHWCAVALTILVDYHFLHASGEQTAAATGLSSLLILALGCLLAGIYLEWMFALVGLLLLATAIFVSVAQEYMALVLVIGFVLIVVIVVVHTLTRRWRSPAPQ